MSEQIERASGLSRRSFLKTTAVTGAAVALGASGVGLAGCATGGGSEGVASEEKRVYSRCMWSGCMHCGRWVIVRDDHVVKQEPDPDETYRNRPCLRGYSQIQRMYHPNRIKYPMKRVGERGSGEWEQISWEQAISEIAAKFNEYREKFGPQSIVLYPGTSNGGLVNGSAISLVKRLWNLAGFSVYDICVDLGSLTGVDRVTGGAGYDQPGNHGGMDLMEARTYINMSGNETECAIFNWRNILDAREKGVRYVVIDPNQTTAAAGADLWIRPRPASDGALLLGCMNVILSEGWEDTEYVRNYTVAKYLVKEDGKFLRASEFGVEPVYMGINYTTYQPIYYDAPIVMGEDGVWGQENEIANPVMTGTFEIEGHKVTCAWDLFRARIAEYDVEKVSKMTEVSPEEIRTLAKIFTEKPVKFAGGMGAQAYNNGHQLGVAEACIMVITGNISLRGGGFTGGYYQLPLNYQYMMPTWTMGPSIPWLETATILETGQYMGQPFPIKCIYSMGAMYGGGIDAKWTKKIIDQLDLLVVADTSMCDTARQADYVLPAAHYFEFEDVISNPTNEGAVKWSGKCVEPPYECKPDGEIMSMLAHALGFGDFFQGDTESYLNEALGSPEFQAAGVTLENLRKQHTIKFPLYDIYHPDHVYDTPTGKLEIYCENPTPRMVTSTMMNWDWEAEHLPYWFAPTDAWPELDIMKKYPLILTSERSRNRHHTNGFELTWLLEALPEPTVKMNPADAEARGIKEGDYVEIYNDRGNVVARASLNPGMRPGMLVYPKGWQRHQFKEGSFSDLSNHEYNPVAVNSSFMDAAVEMRVWKGANE